MTRIMRSLPLIISLTLAMVAPSLCKGGLLVHPCDATHSDTSSDHDGHNEKDGGCGHEEGCAADPCTFAVKSTSGPRVSSVALDGLEDVAVFATAAQPTSLNAIVFSCPGDLSSFTFSLSPPECGVCLPLLI